MDMKSIKVWIKANWLLIAIAGFLLYSYVAPKVSEFGIPEVNLSPVGKGVVYTMTAQVVSDKFLPDGELVIIPKGIERKIEVMALDENGKEIPAPIEGIALIAQGEQVLAKYIDPLMKSAYAGSVLSLECRAGELFFYDCVMVEPFYK